MFQNIGCFFFNVTPKGSCSTSLSWLAEKFIHIKTRKVFIETLKYATHEINNKICCKKLERKYNTTKYICIWIKILAHNFTRAWGETFLIKSNDISTSVLFSFSFCFTDLPSLTSVLPQPCQQTEAPVLHHKSKQEHESPGNVLHLNTRKHSVWLYKDNKEST